MLDKLHCTHCHTYLHTTNLKKWKQVRVRCPNCGQWNEFTYDPKRYVTKAAPPSQDLFGQEADA